MREMIYQKIMLATRSSTQDVELLKRLCQAIATVTVILARAHRKLSTCSLCVKFFSTFTVERDPPISADFSNFSQSSVPPYSPLVPLMGPFLNYLIVGHGPRISNS